MARSPINWPRLHVGAGTTAHALTVFPVWVDSASTRGLHWSGHRLTISEIEGGPAVEHLQVRNDSSRPAVLLEGDLIEGGWQNRMAARSTLVPAHTTRTVAARCVEQGRWQGQSGERTTGQRVPYSVLAARRSTLGLTDQGDVWQRIDRFEEHYGRTPTASMTDHLRRLPAPVFPLLEGQRGVVIGIGGRVVATEIFGRTFGLASRWKGIVAAAWLDAQRSPAIPTSAQQARDLVQEISALPLRPIGGAEAAHQLAAQHRTTVLRGLTLPTDASALVHLSAIDTGHPCVLAA